MKNSKKSYRSIRMGGRNKDWIGPSDWMNEFNKKHNPDYYYGKNTQEKKTEKKKKTGGTHTAKRYPIFKVSD